MKTVSHRSLKKVESQRRMTSARVAQTSARAAKRVQRRVSLAGHGTQWRITNLRQVAHAMAAWA